MSIVRKVGVGSVDANTYPQHLLELSNVYFGRFGTIFSENMELVVGSSLEFLFWADLLKESVPSKLKEATQKPVQQLPDDAEYLFGLHPFNIYVYGHIWDTIQTLKKPEDFGLKNLKLVACHFTHHVNNVKEHFELFGFPPDRIVHHDGEHLLFVKRAWYSSPHCYSARFTRSTRDWMRYHYLDTNPAFQALGPPPPNPTRLYLSSGGR